MQNPNIVGRMKFILAIFILVIAHTARMYVKSVRLCAITITIVCLPANRPESRVCIFEIYVKEPDDRKKRCGGCLRGWARSEERRGEAKERRKKREKEKNQRKQWNKEEARVERQQTGAS